MPVNSSAGRAVGSTIKGARLTARHSTRAGRWVARRVGTFRRMGGAGEIGMMRLLDLHAASCAGDTLVTMGLAGTVFFNVPVNEARGRVALYLLITMAPFALLAPVVGPLLDRFRHGRRYALAVTMLGRAFLAWLISDYLGGIGLYPAAFGVLALSRAYGVARSAAVPRLLPPGLGLSEAGARASIFGTLAGAAVAPLGIAAFWIGPQWPLRVAAVVFVLGTIVALRLPPKADSEPPEVLPRVFQLPSRQSVKVLSGQLIVAVLSGSAALRALYGFLTLFLAFSIRSGQLTTTLFGTHLSEAKALAFAIGSLGVGTFVATAIGSRMRIHRPTLLQAAGIMAVTVAAFAAAIGYSLGLVMILCFATAVVSGFAKLAVDATIQEKISEHVRASAFAHSETLLMLAWVLGGAVGLIAFSGRVGMFVAAFGIAAAAARAGILAVKLRKERLAGVAAITEQQTILLARPSDAATVTYPGGGVQDAAQLAAMTQAAANQAAQHLAQQNTRSGQGGPAPAASLAGGSPQTAVLPNAPAPTLRAPAATSARKARWGWRKRQPAAPAPAPTMQAPSADAPPPIARPTGEADQPSYHLYRPTSIDQTDHPA